MSHRSISSSLEIDNLTIRRGDLTICRDITLSVPAGEITLLLGANGAGKTTLLDGVAGAIPVTGGVQLNGERIERSPMHRRVARGLSYVEQGRNVFTRLTVAQNLAIVDCDPAVLDRTVSLFPSLAEKHDVRAGFLSGGEQQMLIIARALATNPKFLLIDELSLGLAPRIVSTLVDALVSLAHAGVGILLVEQYVDMALEVGSMAHIMERGRIVRSEHSSVLRQDRASLVAKHFLGDPKH